MTLNSDRRWFIAAASASAITVLASAAQDLAVFTGLLHRHFWILDLDFERSIGTWWSILLLGASAILLNDIAERSGKNWVGSIWRALAGLFLLLSLDEFAMFHERAADFLRHYVHAAGVMLFPWALPAATLAALGAVALIPFLRALPRDVAFGLLTAGFIYVFGAAGMEIIGGLVFEASRQESTPLFRAIVTIEEGLEQSGVLLLLYTLIKYRERLPPLQLAALRPARSVA